MMKGVLADRDLKDYFPDYSGNKVPDRQFFWGVLGAIKPCFTQALVKSALDQRSKASGGDAEAKVAALNIQAPILERML